MRKNIAILLVCMLLFSLAACGGDNNEFQDVIAQPPSDNQELLNSYQRLQSENQTLLLEIQELQSEIQRLLTENQDLQAELDSEEEMVEVKATGGFIATVHHTMSDNVFDERHRVVILTMFQDNPFMLRLDPELIAQLEIGETYVFEIEDTPIGSMPLSEFQRPAGGTYPLGFGSQLNIRSIRIAEEYERGLPPDGMTPMRVLVDDN